jgi:hypothetical protein
MTNKKDGLKERESTLGKGQEESLGVSQRGDFDPTGDYPKKDYFYGNSVNKAAKGEKINTLYTGGGDYGVNASVSEQKPSLYPFNQVNETESGHVIEIDDTPGGERVLIKHRTGAGMEMRADGSVVISSRGRRVEVIEEEQVVIVEGEGTLVYKGNLNLSVDGDFNVDVSGNYNLNVAGNKTEAIEGNHKKTVDKNQNYTIRGNRGAQIVGTNSQTTLGDNNYIIKGNQRSLVQGNIDFTTSGNLLTTAVGEWVAASGTANITARTVSMLGHKGTIGGPLVDHYGKSYGGAPGVKQQVAAFYGTLVGKAAEALHADYAITSSYSQLAKGARNALKAGSTGPVTVKPPKPKMGVYPFMPIPATAPCPMPPIIELQLSSGNYGIRNVSISDKLAEKISLSDDYDELFTHNPNIHEIRSKLRQGENESLKKKLASKGLISNTYFRNIPTNIGRSANNDGTARFGLNFIGNNTIDNRSKRFKVKKKS